MRSVLLVLWGAILSVPVSFAANPLAVVKPVISEIEDGVANPPGYTHHPGETLYFACRIANFQKSADSKIHLAYSVQAFDSKQVPLAEIYKNDLSDEVSPQDKDWMPKIETEVAIPPLVPSGNYKIVVKVEDLLAKTTAELDVPFTVRGREVEPSDVLVVRSFRFFADENSTQAMEKPVYHPGDSVWAKFDITGFKYGEGNKIDVNYVTSLIAAGSGKVLWTQPEPAAQQTASFYPKLYIPADFGINLQKNIRPGEYTIGVLVKDMVGNQTCESKQTFTVQ